MMVMPVSHWEMECQSSFIKRERIVSKSTRFCPVHSQYVVLLKMNTAKHEADIIFHILVPLRIKTLSSNWMLVEKKNGAGKTKELRPVVVSDVSDIVVWREELEVGFLRIQWSWSPHFLFVALHNYVNKAGH